MDGHLFILSDVFSFFRFECLPKYISVHHVCSGPMEEQKRVSSPPGLELQTVSFPVGAENQLINKNKYWKMFFACIYFSACICVCVATHVWRSEDN